MKYKKIFYIILKGLKNKFLYTYQFTQLEVPCPVFDSWCTLFLPLFSVADKGVEFEMLSVRSLRRL